jgi:hypothetical protein
MGRLRCAQEKTGPFADEESGPFLSRQQSAYFKSFNWTAAPPPGASQSESLSPFFTTRVS